MKQGSIPGLVGFGRRLLRFAFLVLLYELSDLVWTQGLHFDLPVDVHEYGHLD